MHFNKSILAVTILFSSLLAGDAFAGQLNYNGLTSSEYQQLFDTFVPQGYRVVSVKGYASNGTARYNVKFCNSNGPKFTTHHGMSTSRFQAYNQHYASLGYRLVQTNAFRLNGQLVHVGLWNR